MDDIGDVLEFNSSKFEKVPDNIPLNIKQFLTGVYKLPDRLLSVLDIDSVYQYLNNNNVAA